MNKTFFCILPGLTDQPLRDLGGQTPLQKAQSPNLDELAQNGSCFLVQPPRHGHHATALMALLGVKERLNMALRGPLEAYALGVELEADEVAFSVRFVAEGQGVITDVSELLLNDHEGHHICDDLNRIFAEDHHCRFLHLGGPRAVLVAKHPFLRQAAYRPSIKPMKCLGKKWDEVLPIPRQEELKNLWEGFHEVLAAHEVNALKEDLEESRATTLLVSDGGGPIQWKTPPMALAPEDCVLVSASALSWGVGRTLGIETFALPSERKRFELIPQILHQVPRLLEEKSCILLELHQLWMSTFQGDLLGKIKGIEYIDKYFLSPLKEIIDSSGANLVVVSLCQSDIRKGAVVEGPVPIVCNFPGKPQSCFDETLEKNNIQAVALHDLLNVVQTHSLEQGSRETKTSPQ